MKEQLDLKEDGFYKGIVAYINEKYEHSGFTDALYDIWIEQFGNSVSFDDADFKYYTFIKPILKELTLKQLTELMGAIDSNDQIHNRMRHVSSCYKASHSWSPYIILSTISNANSIKRECK